jgi:P-type Cu+ transporter
MPALLDHAPAAATTWPSATCRPGVCQHCGDACGGGVRTAHGLFCCDGCAAVYAFLQTHGLDTFYGSCPVPPGPSQRAADADPARFAVLDAPEVAARVLRSDDGQTASAIFSVPGLHCASCVWLLERLWRVDARVTRAEVDLVRRAVRVWFRSDRMALREVAALLAQVGYEPALEREQPGTAATPAARRLYLQLGVAGFAFGNIMLFSIPRYANGAPLEPFFQRLFDAVNVALATPVLIYSAADWFTRAWRALRIREVTLDVPVAMGLAALYARSLADIVTARGEGFMDAFAGLVFFLLIGRLCQQKAFDRIAFDRTYRSFLPLTVRVERDGGAATSMRLEDVRVGDRLVLRPHEVVPADAVLVDDAGTIDYAFVTGEATPIAIARGAVVRAGGRVAGRSLRLDLAEPVDHSRLARLWDHPAFRKPITPWLTGVSAAFGRWFTALTLALAAAGAIAWWPDATASLQVASAVLIIACPCALTLAAPVTLGTAMGCLARRGLFLKEPAVALDLSRVDTVLFDKTGTLSAAGQAAAPMDLDAADWALVQRLAADSTHPASRAIAADGVAGAPVEDGREVPGLGIRGRVDGHDVAIGTSAFVAGLTGAIVPDRAGAAAVAVDGRFRGWARLGGAMRAGIAGTIARLRRDAEVWLLSGDGHGEAARWAPLFGADRLRFRRTPQDKLAFVEARRAAGRRVLMVGDGLNDAGALAAADVGLSVSDDTACLVPACDALVRGDALARLPRFLRYARRARQVIVACFLVSVAYNALGLTLALQGRLTPLATAILMPVSSLTIIGLAVGGMRVFARSLDGAGEDQPCA